MKFTLKVVFEINNFDLIVIFIINFEITMISSVAKRLLSRSIFSFSTILPNLRHWRRRYQGCVIGPEVGKSESGLEVL